MPKIPLNIHLFLEEFDELGVLRAKWNPDTQPHIRRLESREPLRFECWMLLQPPRPKRASWADFVAASFDVPPDQVENQYAAAALILKVDGRLFAVSFGHGSGAFLRQYLEPDFGLRFALNQLADDDIQGLSSRSVETNSVQRQHRVTLPGELGRFGVDLNIEWIRQISGKTSAGDRITGGETVKLAWEGALADLDQLCRTVLEHYQRADYQVRFPQVDRRRPVPKNSPLAQRLDAEVNRMVAARSTDLALGHPTMPGADMAGIKYMARRQAQVFDDLHIGNFYTFLASHPDFDFREVSVVVVNSDGDPMERYPLPLCLIAQVVLNGQTYLLLEGAWCSVEADFIRRIQAEVAAVPDLTDVLNLPDMGAQEGEGAYNARVARDRRWHNLDKRNVHYGNQKVEPCDLVLPSRLVPGMPEPPGPVLIAVKKATGSDALSHLFAQGSNSARLLRDEPRFRGRMEAAYQGAFGEALDDRQALIVYAIATEKPGRLADSLFLFAKIHLSTHLATLRLANMRVALCRIARPAALTARPARRRRQ